MSVRFILHVGPHKTGSTYLQSAFTYAADPLLERGVLYPTDIGSLQGHHRLVDLCRRRDMAALTTLFSGLRGSQAQTVLLSSEEFSFMTADELRILRDLIGASEVMVAFYCRRPSELLLSNWRELMKHRVAQSLPEYVVQALTGGRGAEAVNLSILLVRLTTIFGADALRLVPYNTLLDTGADLFQHFCARFLDWPDAPAPTLRRMNRSMSPFDAEIMCVLNRLERQRAGAAGERLFSRLVVYRASLDLAPIIKGMATCGFGMALDETKPPFVNWHQRARDQFSYALVDPTIDNALYPAIAATLHYVRPDYLTLPGMTDAIRALHAHMLTLPEPDPAAFVRDHL